MKIWKSLPMIMAAVVLGACSRDDAGGDAQRSPAAVAPADSVPAQPAADAHSAHTAPDSTGGTAATAAPHGEHAADPHAQHAAGTGTRARATDHRQHQMGNAPAGTSHRAHAQPVSPAHAGHVAPDTTHAAHKPADTAHAAHKPADTTHVAHKPADTTHAAHQPRDTVHAAHNPADTTHAQHAAQEPKPAAHAGHTGTPQEPMHQGHGNMAMLDLGGGWMALGMAQVFPTFTMASPSPDDTPLDRTGVYLTQPALMFNVESPGSSVTFRTTINLEGLTQPDGELTFGGWGEGFIDKRHPHTYLHEAMLSLNLRRGNATGLSISAGKGFAPYGTDDPMMRPVIKYPTNHHLSQILERWTLNGIWADPRWSVEAGLFGGSEPTSPTDLSNIESFGDSWSLRVTRRVGRGSMGAWPWEFAASFGRVAEEHDEEVQVTRLYNVAIRHEGDHGNVHLYTLFEASKSDPDDGDGYYSVLGEFSAQAGRHKPYGRLEIATRPEYERVGPRTSEEFFRYDHDEHAIGSTRWLIASVGWGMTATTLPFGIRPYVEAQYNRVNAATGGIDPVALFGRKSFWSMSAGFRIFLGGDPMRMGSYGILDPMTMMHLMQMSMASAADPAHQH